MLVHRYFSLKSSSVSATPLDSVASYKQCLLSGVGLSAGALIEKGMPSLVHRVAE